MLDDLLSDLILEAFDHYAQSPPRLITVPIGTDSEASAGVRHLIPEKLLTLDLDQAPVTTWAGSISAELSKYTVLAVPPWAMASRRNDIPMRRLEEELLSAIRPPVDANPLGFLAPDAILTQAASKYFRDKFFSTWHPLLILYFRKRVTSGTNLTNYAFVLAEPAPSPQPTKVMLVSDPVETAFDDLRVEFSKLLKRQGGSTQNGFVLQAAPPASESLAFNKLDPAVKKHKEDLSHFGEARKLSELFRLVPPFHTRRSMQDKAHGNNSRLCRTLAGRDILEDGTIASGDPDETYTMVPESFQLKAGDIVVRRVFKESRDRNLIIAVVRNQDLPATSSHTVIALREREELSPAHRRLVQLFLSSPATKRLVDVNSISSASQVTARSLLDASVPVPDAPLALAIEHLDEAAQSFALWSSQAEDIVRTSFTEETPQRARSLIIEHGRSLRLKSQAAAEVDDFDTRVRTRFPYPLALRWRTVQAFASGNDLRRTHEAILETFEVLLCYASMLSHTLARSANLKLGATESIKSKLSSKTAGPGLGDWAAVMLEVAESKKFRKLPEDYPLGDLRHLLRGPAIEARQRLTNHRLNQAHLRRTTHEKFAMQVAEEMDDLRTLFASAEFLADLSLIQIESVKYDSISRSSRLTFRRLMGDHPIVPFESMTSGRSDLESESLYILDADQAPHLLRPFLVGKVCPECNTWSTFHADRYIDGQLTITSLEHGHSLSAPELEDSLQHSGLL